MQEVLDALLLLLLLLKASTTLTLHMCSRCSKAAACAQHSAAAALFCAVMQCTLIQSFLHTSCICVVLTNV
jgi:hypothetical protein